MKEHEKGKKLWISSYVAGQVLSGRNLSVVTTSMVRRVTFASCDNSAEAATSFLHKIRGAKAASLQYSQVQTPLFSSRARQNYIVKTDVNPALPCPCRVKVADVERKVHRYAVKAIERPYEKRRLRCPHTGAVV
jgi:hypothetical protein